MATRLGLPIVLLMSLAAFGCSAGAGATARDVRVPDPGGSSHSASATPVAPSKDTQSQPAARTAEPKSSPDKHDDAYWLQRITPQ